ncbi:MAG: exodeoxyribonuclease VII small subunit [Bryobacteraceae bacterium]
MSQRAHARPLDPDFSDICPTLAWVHTHRYNKAMPEEKTSSPGFEVSLEELERIVKQLEKGDLPLEQSLTLFEAGMRLSADCKRQLEEAETRIEILMKKGSEVVAVPFDPEKPLK